MWTLLRTAFTFFTGTKIIWKVLTNYRILADSSDVISTVFKNLHAENRVTPTQEESQALLTTLSNVIKTGIIDIPGFDEMELVAQIDRVNGALTTSIRDVKSGKYHKVSIKKIKPQAPIKETTEKE